MEASNAVGSDATAHRTNRWVTVACGAHARGAARRHARGVSHARDMRAKAPSVGELLPVAARRRRALRQRLARGGGGGGTCAARQRTCRRRPNAGVKLRGALVSRWLLERAGRADAQAAYRAHGGPGDGCARRPGRRAAPAREVHRPHGGGESGDEDVGTGKRSTPLRAVRGACAKRAEGRNYTHTRSCSVPEARSAARPRDAR